MDNIEPAIFGIFRRGMLVFLFLLQVTFHLFTKREVHIKKEQVNQVCVEIFLNLYRCWTP